MDVNDSPMDTDTWTYILSCFDSPVNNTVLSGNILELQSYLTSDHYLMRHLVVEK